MTFASYSLYCGGGFAITLWSRQLFFPLHASIFLWLILLMYVCRLRVELFVDFFRKGQRISNWASAIDSTRPAGHNISFISFQPGNIRFQSQRRWYLLHRRSVLFSFFLLLIIIKRFSPRSRRLYFFLLTDLNSSEPNAAVRLLLLLHHQWKTQSIKHYFSLNKKKRVA